MQFRDLIIALSMWLSATSAQAFSVTDLRAAVADRDFEAVEAGLSSAQAEFLAGTRSADDMRKLFIVFSRSAPEMVRFVEDWLELQPDNPKAQIARAWSLFEAARQVRSGNNGYSAEVASYMRQESDTLATAAYQNAPYLLPTSDAIVRGVGTVEDADVHPMDVMNGVLMAHPNWGTIKRAIISPAFRGVHSPFRPNFCAQAAAHFDAKDVAKVRHKCMSYIGSFFSSPEIDRYMQDHVWNDTDPETTQDRVSYLIQRTDLSQATKSQVEWIITKLMTHPVDQFEMLFFSQLATHSGLRHGIRAHGILWDISDFKRQRLEEIEGFLEHDPNNISLLDLAEGVAFQQTFERTANADGGVTSRAVKVYGDEALEAERKRASAAQKLDFSLRRIQASPYNSSGWFDLAEYISRHNLPTSFFDGDPAYHNAIFFSDDPMSVITTFIQRKTMHWETLQQFVDGPAKRLKGMADWNAFVSQTNKEQAVICPLLRAQLIREYFCATRPNRSDVCGPGAFSSAQKIATFTEIARNTPACVSLLSQDIETLWYTPVPYREISEKLEGL